MIDVEPVVVLGIPRQQVDVAGELDGQVEADPALEREREEIRQRLALEVGDRVAAEIERLQPHVLVVAAFDDDDHAFWRDRGGDRPGHQAGPRALARVGSRAQLCQRLGVALRREGQLQGLHLVRRGTDADDMARGMQQQPRRCVIQVAERLVAARARELRCRCELHLAHMPGVGIEVEVAVVAVEQAVRDRRAGLQPAADGGVAVLRVHAVVAEVGVQVRQQIELARRVGPAVVDTGAEGAPRVADVALLRRLARPRLTYRDAAKVAERRGLAVVGRYVGRRSRGNRPGVVRVRIEPCLQRVPVDGGRLDWHFRLCDRDRIGPVDQVRDEAGRTVTRAPVVLPQRCCGGAHVEADLDVDQAATRDRGQLDRQPLGPDRHLDRVLHMRTSLFEQVDDLVVERVTRRRYGETAVVLVRQHVDREVVHQREFELVDSRRQRDFERRFGELHRADRGRYRARDLPCDRYRIDELGLRQFLRDPGQEFHQRRRQLSLEQHLQDTSRSRPQIQVAVQYGADDDLEAGRQQAAADRDNLLRQLVERRDARGHEEADQRVVHRDRHAQSGPDDAGRIARQRARLAEPAVEDAHRGRPGRDLHDRRKKARIDRDAEDRGRRREHADEQGVGLVQTQPVRYQRARQRVVRQ